jgi:xylulokinase
MTGLARGVVLVNGGHDQVCTAFGLGINDPGKVLVACGTAWVITGVINSLQMTRMPETLDLNFHILPHRWTQSQSLGGLGAPLEWWLNETISLDRATQFSVLEQELARTQPNQQLFFMPLTGGFDNPATSSAGGFVGLQLSHTRAQMARAIMESAAFELKWSLLHWFKDGMQMDHLFLVGGAAQSSDWLKILAEVCGITIYIPQYDHWPSLGAAYLAGCGLGLFDLEQVPPDNFLKPYHQVIGDERQSALYETKFAAYRECRVDFNRLMRKIATRV